MDKLKQVLSRNKDEPEGTQDAASRGAGQGSHFASKREPSSTHAGNDNLGSTTIASMPQTSGAPDTSAASPSTSLARDTTGPDAGAQSHFGEVSPGATDSPSHGRNAGVPEGSAQTAASRAFGGSKPHGEGMPGTFPSAGYENPYKATNFDPRVDGLPARSKEETSALSTSHTQASPIQGSSAAGPHKSSMMNKLDPRVDSDRDHRSDPSSTVGHGQTYSAGGPGIHGSNVGAKEYHNTTGSGHYDSNTGAGTSGAALATAGAATVVSGHETSREPTTPLPATLTSTGSPMDQPTEYGQAETTRIPETADASAMSPRDTPSEPQQSSSMFGRAMGAVGLGSFAGAGAAAATRSGGDSAVDASECPMTTTGTDSYRSPSQSGPPPSHHRKESIPTTAYPDGPNSARPIAPPIGGTRPPTEQAYSRPEDDSRFGHNTAIGAGAGASGLSAYESDRTQAPTSSTLDQTGAIGAGGDQSGLSYSQPPPTTERKPETHYGRDTAIGAGAMGAAGAGVIGAHEYEQSRGTRRANTGEPSRFPTSGTTGAPAQEYGESSNLRQGLTTHDAVTMPATATTERGYEPSAIPATATTGREYEPANMPATTGREYMPNTTSAMLPAGRESVIPQPKEEDHTKRNAALAGVAGVGAAGAGAYGAEEYSREHAEKEAARRAAEHEKELARQRHEMEKQQAAQAKQAEKEQKAAEKEAAKEEKAHQKEIEQREKAAAKEREHTEKEAEKERADRDRKQALAAAAADKERQQQEEEGAISQKERLRQYEESKRRREEEGAAAGTVAYGDRHHSVAQDPTTKDGEDLEKKPSLLKRIFSRKNKDTGEDEEYEAEEEEKQNSHRGAAAAGVAGAGAAGGAAYAMGRDEKTGAPQIRDAEEQPLTKYEEQSGGFIKPSYNPFTKKDQPEGLEGTADINHEHTGRTGEHMPYQQKENALVAGSATGPTTGTATERIPEYAEDSHDRNRLRKDPPSDHPAATGRTGEPIDPVTGQPYDPSKDPQAAARLGEHHHGAGMGEGTSTAQRMEHEVGEDHHKSLGEKMKEKLGLGHH